MQNRNNNWEVNVPSESEKKSFKPDLNQRAKDVTSILQPSALPTKLSKERLNTRHYFDSYPSLKILRLITVEN